jgi:hypothetical protein
MTGSVELAPGEFILFVSQGGTEEQDSRFLAVLKMQYHDRQAACQGEIPI